MTAIVRFLRLSASWVLWIVSVVLGVPALVVVHLVTTMGDMADDLWEEM